ncbi:MAG: TIM barrel protein [Planctomycetota bacterium]|nr:TIM barrel protein [Planctomycetota bacterium]
MSRLKPSVCIDAVFEGQPAATAIDSVYEAGIRAFEFWGWWDRNLDELIELRDQHKMQIASCCTKFISLVDPVTRDDYLKGLEETLVAAEKLKVSTIISQVGDLRTGIDRQAQHDCLVEGLKEAAPMLEAAGRTLVIEPLNELVDHAGYYLIRSDEACEIVEEVGSSNVKVVFDIYHQQISEGHLIHNITQNIDKIGHFHAAGTPGRNELTRGEIHYSQVFEAIQSTNYDGYVGLEYWPVEPALEGLKTVSSWF